MLRVKPSSSEFSNVITEKFIRKSFQDCSKATLQAVIRGRVTLDSIIYSEGWLGYNGLVDVGYGKHLRIDHERDEFAKGVLTLMVLKGFGGSPKLVCPGFAV